MKISKSLLFFSLSGLLSACAQIKIVEFDNSQKTVTVQGTQVANDEDFQKAADGFCRGPAKLLSMKQAIVGSETNTNIQPFGDGASAQSTTTGVTRYNRVYSCNP